jgi:hypothetical protein
MNSIRHIGYINLTENGYKFCALVNMVLNCRRYVEGEEFLGYLSDC